MIFTLNPHDFSFPDPAAVPDEYRESDGCFAIGGDLSPQRLVEAYSLGIFPWSSFRSPHLLWYCPMRRFVIFTDKVHVSHSMRTLINKSAFSVTFDKDFEAVIGNCSNLRISQRGAWLGPAMVRAYTRLHELGYAHSVEVWCDGSLVGGLYGVMVNRAFCGESMFSLQPNASKFGLISLCRLLHQKGVPIVDCQFETDHLRSMGGVYIDYDQYMDIAWGDPITD